MKKLSLVFAGLLITFFISWGIKVKMPVNRPDNTETASTVKWYETKYTAPVADDEWILDPEIPDNLLKRFRRAGIEDPFVFTKEG